MPSRADLTFHKAKKGGKYARLNLAPIKKKGGKPGQKVPQLIAKSNGNGSDTYAALKRLEKYDPIPERNKKTTPLFSNLGKPGKSRSHIRCAQFRLIMKNVAQAAGQDPKLFGAHSGRIGGSTDLSAQKVSPILLQAKGRWGSDIGKIYARMTRRSQLTM